MFKIDGLPENFEVEIHDDSAQIKIFGDGAGELLYNFTLCLWSFEVFTYTVEENKGIYIKKQDWTNAPYFQISNRQLDRLIEYKKYFDIIANHLKENYIEDSV